MASPRTAAAPRTATVRSPRVFWLVHVATFVALFLLCSAWSLATPISGGTDESGHIMKAAASVRGIWTGTPTDRAGIEQFVLPANVADVGEPMTCFAFHPERSAACAPSLDNASAGDVAVETGVGSYNPLYYVMVGWPSLLLTGEPAIYAMRLVSGLLTASTLTLMFWAARALTNGSRYLLAAPTVALTPMVYFLGGVINPNGLESAGVAAFVVLLWLVLSRTNTSPTALVGLSAVTAVVANLRSTSPLYLLLAAVAVITAVGWPRAIATLRQGWVLVAAAAAVAAAGLGALWTLTVALPAGFIPSSGKTRDDVVTAVGATFGKSTDYARELVGVFGWLDTPLPDWIYALWAAMVGAVLVGGLALAGRGRFAAICISLASLALIPAAIQAPSAAEYGYIWQGRYSLPLFVTAIIVAGVGVALTIDGAGARAARRVLVILAISAAAAQCTAFVATLYRYTVGDEAEFAEMFDAPQWLPPGDLTIPMLLCGAGAIGLCVVVLLGGGDRGRMPRTPPPSTAVRSRPRHSAS